MIPLAVLPDHYHEPFVIGVAPPECPARRLNRAAASLLSRNVAVRYRIIIPSLSIGLVGLVGLVEVFLNLIQRGTFNQAEADLGGQILDPGRTNCRRVTIFSNSCMPTN